MARETEMLLNCHNSGCMQDRVVIFDSRVGFSGAAYLMASFKFTPDYPCCHSNEIWDKIGDNSTYIRDIPEIFAYSRVFGVGLLNDAKKFYRDQPVAMATKFGTKSAITRLVQEIALRRLRLTGVFWGRAIE